MSTLIQTIRKLDPTRTQITSQGALFQAAMRALQPSVHEVPSRIDGRLQWSHAKVRPGVHMSLTASSLAVRPELPLTYGLE